VVAALPPFLTMAAPNSTLRQRGLKKKASNNQIDAMQDSDVDTVIATAKKQFKPAVKSEWDYKLALVILTIAAFATRFYGITHPNQVVFDEVHFGKVRQFAVHIRSQSRG
jgi:dolichyl-phosphate-mannose-protein mannosyltransferase